MDLSHLNQVQQQAVTTTEGACMVIAGAGSGKTSVLTHRIAFLLGEKQVAPSHILALTFTNKAASEMRQRIEKIVGVASKQLWLGTFHSMFLKILRQEANCLGYPHHFTIYDTDDSKDLIRSIIKEMRLDDKVYKPNVVFSRISHAKNRLITAEEYAQDARCLSDDENAGKPFMGKIFLAYAHRCRQAGAMDFDDLIANTYQIFQYPKVLQKYQERFRYILIDEFQDTNKAQYTIIKYLALLHQNICVVGDDAQSIYAFRGADIQNILDFRKDYPALQLIKLVQNYRSTQHIVSAANSIIRHNKAQLQKEVWTNNERGEPLEVVRAATDTEEGRLIAASIFENRANHQLENSDFAILYRTNSQSRSMEEALRRMNLPYRIIGGISFYQRKEVKDLLAYLRLIVNPNDEASLKRIINLPKRGIGSHSVDKLVKIATAQAMPLWDVVSRAAYFLGNRIGSYIETFAEMIQRSADDLAHKDAYAIARDIAKQSGLLKALQEEKTIEDLGRYENVQELLNGIKAFTNNADEGTTGLADFLREVALVTSMDESDHTDTNKITLMTIHSAKGLEFAYVYVVGLEEELFPSSRIRENPQELEEERRLFYVALTRAKRKIFLTFALSRYRFGRLKHCEPSRFIAEIDAAYLQPNTRSAFQTMGHHTAYAHRLVKQHRAVQTRSSPLHPQSTPDFQPSNASHIEVGMKILHAKFGHGTVRQLEVIGTSKKAIIHFADFGEKTLLLSFAKIKIIE